MFKRFSIICLSTMILAIYSNVVLAGRTMLGQNGVMEAYSGSSFSIAGAPGSDGKGNRTILIDCKAEAKKDETKSTKADSSKKRKEKDKAEKRVDNTKDSKKQDFDSSDQKNNDAK